MLRAIGRLATIVALCLSLGFHWLALQSVAWTSMLFENVRHTSLTEAVAKTFDGSHPCNLCRVVSAGKKSEKKSEVLPTIAKLDLICTTRTWTCLPSFAPYVYPGLAIAFGQRVERPPLPPPRFFLS
jgi:hypothetical protein